MTTSPTGSVEALKESLGNILLAYAIRDMSHPAMKDLKPLTLAEANRRLMEIVDSESRKARIDEQENHIMLDGSNVGCQGCYNAIAYNSDRLAELKGDNDEA